MSADGPPLRWLLLPAATLLGVLLMMCLAPAGAERIEDFQIWTGDYEVTEDLLVTSTGSLVLRDANVTFTPNTTTDKPLTVTIQKGGSMRVERSALTGHGKGLVVIAGGSVRISDSSIDGLGGKVQSEAGLVIRADGVRVERTTLANATWAGVVIESGSPRLDTVTIRNAVVGVVSTTTSNIRIEHGRFEHIERQGINLQNGGGFVRDLTFSDVDLAVGVFRGSPRLERLTIDHARIGVDLVESDLFLVRELDIHATEVALRQSGGNVQVRDSTLRSDATALSILAGNLTLRSSTIEGAVHGIALEKETFLTHVDGTIAGKGGYGIRLHGANATYEVGLITGSLAPVAELSALTVTVLDHKGVAAPNVSVELRDSQGTLLWTERTDPSGALARREEVAWLDKGIGPEQRTPHVLRVSHQGRVGEEVVDLNDDVFVTATVPPPPPEDGFELPAPWAIAAGGILIIALVGLAVRSWLVEQHADDDRGHRPSRRHGRGVRSRRAPGGRSSATGPRRARRPGQRPR